MSAARDWLREHVAHAPVPLLRTMLDVLPAEQESVPDALAAGALALYERVAGGSGGREDALPLLAADALFTHAFQAQAQVDPEGCVALASRWESRLAEVAS